MKKYVWFTGVFIIAFIVLQVLSGMLLTMLYTPSIRWEEISGLSSQVEFGSSGGIPSLVIALMALAIAFGVTRLFSRKNVL